MLHHKIMCTIKLISFYLDLLYGVKKQNFHHSGLNFASLLDLDLLKALMICLMSIRFAIVLFTHACQIKCNLVVIVFSKTYSLHLLIIISLHRLKNELQWEI